MSEISWRDFTQTSMLPFWVWVINAAALSGTLIKLLVAADWKGFLFILCMTLAMMALYVADLLTTVQRGLLEFYRGYIRELGGDA